MLDNDGTYMLNVSHYVPGECDGQGIAVGKHGLFYIHYNQPDIARLVHKCH